MQRTQPIRTQLSATSSSTTCFGLGTGTGTPTRRSGTSTHHPDPMRSLTPRSH